MLQTVLRYLRALFPHDCTDACARARAHERFRILCMLDEVQGQVPEPLAVGAAYLAAAVCERLKREMS